MCRPGWGTSAAYDASSAPYYSSVQQLAFVRAAVLAQQQELLRSAMNEARFDVAEQAYTTGNIRVASRLFATLARTPSSGPFADRARTRLNDLAAEARQKLAEVDESLRTHLSEMSASAFFSDTSWPADWQSNVNAAFEKYDRIADDYGAVPTIKNVLRAHVARQRRRPEYAAALHEAEAKALWQIAQQHEEEDHPCCAFWVYDKASRLAPAPSARRAEIQLAKMKQDPSAVAAADTCRQLQWCHRTYNIAEKLTAVAPDRARELFLQIVEQSPADAQVHLAARSRLATLSP